MCNFFSAVSRKGVVKFFTPEDIVSLMVEGNPEKYDWNSHTSCLHFLGVKAKDEDQWTKWEYNPETKELKVDDNGPEDDRKTVQKALDKFFIGKDVLFLRNLYGNNPGNWNSGKWNSGDRNSGNWNSGDGNSGNWNSGNGILNSFCTKRQWMLFDKPCTEPEYQQLNGLDWSLFWTNKWVSESDMTDDEKNEYPSYKTCGGYLKKIEYKEAWKACPQSFRDAVKKLANYDGDKFFEISGTRL